MIERITAFVENLYRSDKILIFKLALVLLVLTIDMMVLCIIYGVS